MDLSGFGIGKMSRKVKEIINMMSSVGSNFYPETMYKFYIVNAPLVFKGVWATIKIFLATETQKKIMILGSS